MGDEIGVYPTLIAQIETGQVEPTRDHLRRMAQCAGLTDSDAEDLMHRYEELRQRRTRRHHGEEDFIADLTERLREQLTATYQRLLELPPPWEPPQPEDRQVANELWERMKDLKEEIMLSLVRVAEEYQTWALCEKLCQESIRETPRNLERAAFLARLAVEVAARVDAPEEWLNRLCGYAAAHEAKVLKAAGEGEAATTRLEEARRLWQEGADPAGMLDPGDLLEPG